VLKDRGKFLYFLTKVEQNIEKLNQQKIACNENYRLITEEINNLLSNKLKLKLEKSNINPNVNERNMRKDYKMI
jgi:hypothetical protein